MVALMLHTTSSTVYYVISDDHYTTNNNTYTLQHYLNNIKKYFTSHTQLHFLPGQYYLNTDLIIQHVSNLSLIGSRTNEVINSVIKCTSPAGIVVVGSSNIVIANMEMKECGNLYSNYLKNYTFRESSLRFTSLLVLNSWSITCNFFRSHWNKQQHGIKFVNVFNTVVASNLTSGYLAVWINGNDNKHMKIYAPTVLHIKSFQPVGVPQGTYMLL